MKTPAPGKKRPVKRRAPGLTREQAEEVYARLAEIRPEPRTELDYVNPYTLVVAVALSAQATDVGVNKATRGLFAAADNPHAMLALGEDGVREHIKTIGLFRNKAKNIIALSRLIIEEFGGEVPRTREDLMRLPGVGRKTANVVLNEAFGEPTIAVDTHIFRVANRTGLGPGKKPRRGGGAARSHHAGGLSQGRASLADPARTLCVQGAQTRMLALRDR